jgi:hypothetical protein
MTVSTPYDIKRAAEIARWEREPPALLAAWVARASGPAARTVQHLIPTAALRLALQTVERTARHLTDERSIRRLAKVEDLALLRQAPLQDCDALAKRIGRRASLLAGGSGAAWGLAGGVGLVGDVPTLLVMTFRAIRRIGLCFGESEAALAPQRVPLAIFAIASANTVEDKEAGLAALNGALEPGDAGWREGVEAVAQRQLAKEAANLSLQRLARQASIHLGWRKAAEALPIAGALVGASVNTLYMRDVARTASYAFAKRWLEADELRRLAPPGE